mgnify:CR=1 FL=1
MSAVLKNINEKRTPADRGRSSSYWIYSRRHFREKKVAKNLKLKKERLKKYSNIV